MKNIKKDKEPYNAQGQRHGLWVWYHSNGSIFINAPFVNGENKGLCLEYNFNGSLRFKYYFI